MSDVSPALMWAIIGLILILMELATISFVLMFFGIGALVTALLTWLGVTDTLMSQLTVFILVSIALFAAFRRVLKNLFHLKDDVTAEHIGQRCRVTKEIPRNGGEGNVDYRSSVWIAFTDSPDPIPVGSEVEITALDGTRLKVRRID